MCLNVYLHCLDCYNFAFINVEYLNANADLRVLLLCICKYLQT